MRLWDWQDVFTLFLVGVMYIGVTAYLDYRNRPLDDAPCYEIQIIRVCEEGKCRDKKVLVEVPCKGTDDPLEGIE